MEELTGQPLVECREGVRKVAPPQKPSNAGLKGIKQAGRLCKEGARLGIQLLRPRTLAWVPRLLKEGLAPLRQVASLKLIEAHNMREIKNLLADEVPITFVTSYPRSGNTWMRYLLSDVFLQIHGIDTDTKLAVHPDEIIADFYCSRVAMRNKAVRTPEASC